MADRSLNKACYINIAETKVVYSGKCILKRIIIGTTAAGAITIYDNTSAAGMPLCVLKASIAEGVYEFDCVMTSGITIVSAGATVGTVIYQEWDAK